MKTMISYCVKIVLPLVLFVFSASGQKLPNVQEASIRAPATIKIDGKPTEWNNQFQAYNKATEIYYTISNDNENLYMAIQTTDQDIANKIIYAGLTFVINGLGKMKDQNGIAVTYPFIKKDALPVNAPPLDYRNESAVMNNQFMSLSKDIKITGIKNQDSIISIYNQEGVKAVALFDEAKTFTYELAIPLKYLRLSMNVLKPFTYYIKLNGIRNDPYNVYPGFTLIHYIQIDALQHVKPYLRSGVTSFAIRGDVMSMTGPLADKIKGLISPTDFWGEYTLKK